MKFQYGLSISCWECEVRGTSREISRGRISIFWAYLDPKVCEIMAFMAVIMGLRPLFYILLGFRYVGFSVKVVRVLASDPRLLIM